MHAELDRVVCSGPRRGRQFTYALLEERVPPARSWTRDQSLAELVRRYFMTRGPATLADFAWWSGLTLSDARNGMEMVKSQFHSETVDEQTYWFSDSPPRTRLRSPAAHLLPNYDEYFIGFRDRSPIGQVARQAGIDKSDPALLANIVILDGQVVGGWKRTLRREEVAIETSLFIQPSQAEEKAIRDAAERFGAFLGLPVSYGQKEYATDRRWNSRSF